MFSWKLKTLMAISITSTCINVVTWLKENGCSDAICSIFEGLQYYADCFINCSLC